MGIIKQLVGKRFGRLTVISFNGLKNNRYAQWMCKCDCGNYRLVITTYLNSGNVSSCGCLKVDTTRARSTKHGHNTLKGATPEYTTWSNIKARCYDEKNKSYSRYGAKGIRVCDRWINSFDNFLSDMGTRPSNDHSIDRFPNKKGDYEPSNCRWATRHQQVNNKTSNIIIDYKGETKTLSQWCEELNLGYHLVFGRLKYGWSVKDAFEKPKREIKK